MSAIVVAGIISSTFNALAPFAAIDLPAALKVPALPVVGLALGLGLRDIRRIVIALGITIVLSTVIVGVVLAVPGFDTDFYTVSRFNYALTQSVLVLFLSGGFVTIGVVIAVMVNIFVRRIELDEVGVGYGPETAGWDRRPVRDEAGERP